jgi:UDP-3-O-[3-hydroxymyristoyl] glucosamine N-acyltransferase
MNITAHIIAQLIDGTIEGNPQQQIDAPCGIEQAEPHHITFLANPKYDAFLYSTKAGIVLIDQNYELKSTVNATLIRVPNVYEAVAMLLRHFGQEEQVLQEIHPSAIIDPEVKIGNHVSIGAGSVIEKGVVIADHVQIGPQVWIGKDSSIGLYTKIHPGVKVYHGTIIGNRCIIQANCVIGSDGFGYSRDGDGVFTRVPQLGKVVLGDEVELGANTCIDRATMGTTYVGKGSKLDNLIHIAHNVRIGEHTAMAAQTGIAGSAKIGSHCLIGGQVGIAGHISIADRTEIQAQSGISGTIEEPGKKLFGSPAIDYMSYVRSYTLFKKLPELAKTLYSIEKRLKK